MGKDKRTHFWASYADLMTSLFFLMVVLFIISIVELKQIDATPLEVKELKAERDSLLNLNSRMVLRQKQYSEELDSMRYLANATQAHIDKINEINDATKNLDQNYFVYDSINKKHKLNFVVRFKIDDDQIYNISKVEREKLLSVGMLALMVMVVWLFEKDLISVVTAKKLLFITKMTILISIILTFGILVITQFS